MGAGDIRLLGDGNVGARTAYWELGPKVGVGVFFFDATKGLLPVLLAQAAALPQMAVLGTGMAAVVGHNWPVFLGFRGGRGEATTIGVLSVVALQPMLAMAVPALATLLIRRSVILASGVLFIPLSLVCWWMGAPGVIVAYSLALPCLVGLTHYMRARRASGASRAGAA
jgi:glycerol-3-phosphate acyltransferase PlsY